MAVTEQEVPASWREFFDTGTNWKDFESNMKDILEYRTMEYYRRRYTEK